MVAEIICVLVMSKYVDVIPRFQSWKICVPTIFQNVFYLQPQNSNYMKQML